jgi:tetrahydromethanopterin S-methyltransferase subunit B
MSKKIILDEEIELTEREEQIYDKGMEKGMDVGFMITIGCVALVAIIIAIFVNK